MLNVDCDMFANNPQVALRAMCLLLGFHDDVHSGFVQVPQKFYGALKDDPFGNQMQVPFEVRTVQITKASFSYIGIDSRPAVSSIFSITPEPFLASNRRERRNRTEPKRNCCILLKATSIDVTLLSYIYRQLCRLCW
jgi:hypothetical protein